MKKLILMLTAIFTLAFSSLCMAADGGALNKAQDSAEKFMAGFKSTPAAYTEVAGGFSTDLKSKINAQAFAELQKQVKSQFGNVKNNKFFSYERYDQFDRVTYISNCTKEDLVAFILTCDKKGRLVDFAITKLLAEKASK